MTDAVEVTETTTEAAFEWITSDVVLRLHDQHGVDIPGSTIITTNPAGSQVVPAIPTGQVVTLPITDNSVYSTLSGALADGYAYLLRPGIAGWQPFYYILSRSTEPLDVTITTTQAAFEWITISGPLQVVDENEIEIAGSQYKFSSGALFGTGSEVALPITDNATYPTLAGTWADGYDVSIRPDGAASFSEYFAFELASDATFSPAFVDIDGAAVGLRFVPNTPPVAEDDDYQMWGTELTVPASGVLANDTDGEDDPLTAQLADDPEKGTVVVNPDGSFTYTPGASFDGVDSFTYRANDGTELGNVATVSITHMLYVRNTSDSGESSLRWAIETANTHPNDPSGPDAVWFDIGGGGVQTIALSSALPTVTDPVTIDGTRQPGYAGSPLIQVDSAAVAGTVLTITAGDSTVRGMGVVNATGAIRLSGGSGSLIEANDVSGSGISISGGSNNTIRNNDVSQAGYIGIAVSSSDNNTIEDNDVRGAVNSGINLDGTSGGNIIRNNDASGSGKGIYVTGTGLANQYLNNDVSSTNSYAIVISNDTQFVLSGNDFTDATQGLSLWNMSGVLLDSARLPDDLSTTAKAGTHAALALNNVTDSTIDGLDLSSEGVTRHGVGLRVNGGSGNTIQNVNVADRNYGIYLSNSDDNTVQYNVTGANNGGILLRDSSSNTVEHNNASGSGLGINISGGSDNTIRYNAASQAGYVGIGVSSSDNNTIADNDVSEAVWSGITLGGTSGSNIIRNNDASGSRRGIYADSTGLANQYLDNDVSSTSYFAMRISNDTQFVVSGNDFTDAARGLQLANMSGLTLDSARLPDDLSTTGKTAYDPALELNNVTDSTIDGLDLSSDGATRHGRGLSISGGSGNTIQNVTVSNRSYGIYVSGANDMLIRGSQIVGSSSGVVIVGDSSGIRIQGNSIHSSVGLGIDLSRDGVTLNDPGDADTGANNLQNFPVLSEVAGGLTTRVQGSLNSTAETTFTLDFYANAAANPSGYGEGERWLGSTTVATDASGNVDFDVQVAAASTVGEFITATATAPDGSTSEFSAVLEITNTPPTAHAGGPYTVGEGTPLTLDASASSDPDDDPLQYRWDFDADGTWDTAYSAEPTAEYTWPDDYSGSVNVEVSDGQATDTATATVVVNNVAPTLDDATLMFSIEENSPNGTAVGTVTGTDPGDDTLTYSITGGSGETAFAIDSETGAITVADETQLDFETTPSLTVDVQVADDDGGTETATVTVNLLNQASITGVVFVDVNENGLYEANEPGIDGVIIELLDEFGDAVLDDLGVPVTATTSNGGFYLFEDLEIGTYQLHELQPSGVEDGAESLGSLDGTIPANDTMQLALSRTDATDYVFAELGQEVASGDAATIGFWQNKHGQQLIGQGGTNLAGWLTAKFGNVFGDTFADGVGDDGSEVATFFRDQLFRQKSEKSAGPAKVDAQFMAVALATYFTSSNLANDVAVDFGFNVTETGIGTKVVNVGTSGAAFNTVDGADVTIMQLLLATNALTDLPDELSGFAHIYDQDGDGQIDDAEAVLRTLANDVYSAINEQGDI